MSDSTMGFETKLVHGGELPPVDRAVTLPIFQSSTFQYKGESNYHDVRYLRLNNNPNQLAVSEKIALLEGAESGIVTASGMAAISTAVLALVGPGQHLLSQEELYGGSRYFFDGDFAGFGRKASYFPIADIGRLEQYIRPETRVIYVESISNPMVRVPDLARVVKVAKERGILTMIDNTFCSPVIFRPSELGFDVILHSATKYLNGHSDVVAGAVIGKRDAVKEVRQMLNLLGAALDPHACFLLHRGLKTLGLRVRRQNEIAHALALELVKHPKVKRVHYPGLPEHPGHEFAKKWFSGFGAVIAFEIEGTGETAEGLLSKFRLPFNAPSLGGVESLITRPAVTSHAGLTREQRARQGIGDNLIRVSVGIEDFDDLARDFRQALDQLR